MASLNEQLTELQTARDNMKIALENKGQSITKDIRTYADAISNISSSDSETTGMKQFATEEEMNADPTAKEGDLAVVYGETINNMTATAEVRIFSFPSIVVLPEAFASDAYCMFEGTNDSTYFSGQVVLSASNFEFRGYSENDEIYITYTSEDGITYIRTDSGSETIDCGLAVKCRYEEEWNDAIGYFMQASIYNFGGLFKYESIQDTSKATFVSNLKYDNGIVCDTNKIDGYVFNDYIKVFQDVTSYLETTPSRVLITKDNNIITVYCYKLAVGSATMGNITLYNGKVYAGLVSTNLANFTNYKFVFTEDLSSYEVTVLTPVNIADKYYYLDEIPSTAEITGISTPGTYPSDISFVHYDTTATTGYVLISYGEKYLYTNAPTQLTAIKRNVYDATFYGKNGVFEGNLQKTNNLTLEQLQQKVEIWDKFNHLSVGAIRLSNAFQNMTFTTIPYIDTSEATGGYYMFSGCINLTHIPLLITSNMLEMGGMFNGCTSLKEVPLLDTSNSESTAIMFQNCTSLIECPQFDTSNVREAFSMFNNCTSLTTVPVLNSSKFKNGQNGMMNMFRNCSALTDESLNNILLMCINATTITTATYKSLKYIGLTEEQVTRCQTLSNYQAFLNAGCVTGY